MSDTGFRISDRDREAAAQALGEHYAAGRLDKAEYDVRVDRIWSARTNLDLAPAFSDLPAPHGPLTAPPADPGLPAQRRGRVVAPPWAGRRGPFGPWLLLIVPVAIIAHAPWLLLGALFVLFVVRPRLLGRC